MKATKNTFATVIVAAFMLGITACASAPDRPDSQLARAETSIELAEQNGAREYSSAALKRARDHLAQARTAAADEDYELAMSLAEKAQLDAELAVAQTNRYKAEEALDEIRDSIESLRRESVRENNS